MSEPGADPTLWSATEQAAAIARGELASRELLEAFRARIDQINPAVNAVVTLDLERATARAGEADDAVARGETLGPLHGLPITIKDAIETDGIRSTGGAVALRDHVPTHNAPAVQSVIDAGAVVFGKTNLPEWSGDLQSYNEIFGVTSNPWDLSRTPGGSSGGAAAAVATGMTAFEIGTDIGGSVRLPAAFSGVWGHKPSFGIIPTLGYLDQVGGGRTEADVNVFGPLTRSVDDLDLLLDVLVSPAPDRSSAWRIELPSAGFESLSELRVAVWATDPACPVDPAIEAAVHATADAFESAGAAVDRNARPAFDPGETARLGMGLISVAASVSMDRAELDELVERHGSDVAAAIRHLDWIEADRRRTAIRGRWSAFFEDFDLLLCPVAITAAIEHQNDLPWAERTLEVGGESRRYADLIFWTSLIGMAYLPSTVPVVSSTADGLPIGVQVVGPFLGDRKTIRSSRLLADHIEGAGYRPPPLVC